MFSIDVETHGALEDQTVFHPVKIKHLDRPSLLLVTFSLTRIEGDPEDPTTWTPGPTATGRGDSPSDLALLSDVLTSATTLLGHNLLYDIPILRATGFHLQLDGRQRLVDTTILNYLHDEVRPERSLKNLGPLFGLYSYDDEGLPTIRSGHRFTGPSDPTLHAYNAADTHNTVLLAGFLAERLNRDFPDAPKLSPDTLRFFSDDLWSCVRMMESGVPFSAERLARIHRLLLTKSRLAEQVVRTASPRHGLPPLIFHGEGSNRSQLPFLTALMEKVHAATGRNPLEDPLLKTTEKLGLPSFAIQNFNLLRGYLPPSHPLQPVLFALLAQTKAEKLLTSYTSPLLWDHKPTSTLLPETHPWSSSPPPTTSESSSTTTSTSPPSSATSSDGANRTATSLASQPSSLPLCAPPFEPNVPLRTPPSSPPSPSTPSPSSSTGTTPVAKKYPPGHPANKRAAVTLRRSRAALRPSPSDYYTGEWRTVPPPTFPSPILFAYPNWFPIPSFVKDDAGGTGGTEQGRKTVKNPALQTLPRLIQQALTTRYPGGRFMGFDLSQIELRIAAILSGEPSLISAFQTGSDLHTERAHKIFGESALRAKYGCLPTKSTPGFDELERPVGKMANFAIDLYLASAEAAQSQTLKMSGVYVPVDLFAAAVRTRIQIRPHLHSWQMRLLRETEHKGYVVACPILGITRTITGDVGGEFRSQVVNCPVQTCAGNVLRAIEHRICSRLPSLNDPDPPHRLCMQVYDAVKIDTRDPAEARGLVMEATSWVEQHGYYARLCDHTGHHVPLIMD